MGLGVGGTEGEQPGALLSQCGAVLRRQWLEGPDEQGDSATVPRDLPGAADDASPSTVPGTTPLLVVIRLRWPSAMMRPWSECESSRLS